MVQFTNIPKHMDKQIYMKTLSKEYKMPLDMIFCLIRDLNTEEEFYKMLEWNKAKKWFWMEKMMTLEELKEKDEEIYNDICQLLYFKELYIKSHCNKNNQNS